MCLVICSLGPAFCLCGVFRLSPRAAVGSAAPCIAQTNCRLGEAWGEKPVESMSRCHERTAPPNSARFSPTVVVNSPSQVADELADLVERDGPEIFEALGKGAMLAGDGHGEAKWDRPCGFEVPTLLPCVTPSLASYPSSGHTAIGSPAYAPPAARRCPGRSTRMARGEVFRYSDFSLDSARQERNRQPPT